ncbi:MAG: bifunctional phosphoribosyl-AMP cyclohydrolase/phosphoribosyl-ATP diphosphatase HisIE, partial [Bacteroidota bacterium]
ALELTRSTGKVTFYSRSKNRIWMKGESSGNTMDVVSIHIDCDNDTLLIKAHPAGPVCHTGADTCFHDEERTGALFLDKLEKTIQHRYEHPDPSSYTSQLFAKGINKVAQKVGEEAVEIVIEAKDDNADLFLGEAADLLYHYLILLKAKGFELNDVVQVLEKRNKK